MTKPERRRTRPTIARAPFANGHEVEIHRVNRRNRNERLEVFRCFSRSNSLRRFVGGKSNDVGPHSAVGRRAKHFRFASTGFECVVVRPHAMASEIDTNEDRRSSFHLSPSFYIAFGTSLDAVARHVRNDSRNERSRTFSSRRLPDRRDGTERHSSIFRRIDEKRMETEVRSSSFVSTRVSTFSFRRSIVFSAWSGSQFDHFARNETNSCRLASERTSFVSFSSSVGRRKGRVDQRQTDRFSRSRSRSDGQCHLESSRFDVVRVDRSSSSERREQSVGTQSHLSSTQQHDDDDDADDESRRSSSTRSRQTETKGRNRLSNAQIIRRMDENIESNAKSRSNDRRRFSRLDFSIGIRISVPSGRND